jgi:2-polyprenyl-3-methyl-5-hydroxy-6-metoxy-1,4-benzoquinol methylase
VTMPAAGEPIKTEYVLDNAWHGARERLRLLEETLDPGTIRHLETVGVASGWRCLEVGGGGGSITAWLCQRVGPAGRVVATDIDTRFLDALSFPNLEVRQQNVVTDAIEEAAFDLVHTRAVLMHLPERQRALDRLVAALKPGGWLLLE